MRARTQRDTQAAMSAAVHAGIQLGTLTVLTDACMVSSLGRQIEMAFVAQRLRFGFSSQLAGVLWLLTVNE